MKRIALIASGLLAVQAASAGVYVETVNRDIADGHHDAQTEDLRPERLRPFRRSRGSLNADQGRHPVHDR